MSSSAPRALSNREEDALMKSVKAEGLKKCDDVVKRFADCASGRTVSVAWACRDEHKAVQSCLSQYTSPDALDRARKEWLNSHRS
ncbi:hypothetical protein BCV69DRAFT_312251 [Microstroma glucosiphilum]|uniref:COX assembly mitochondrial protein n=1 Tax=Pseudomicrostroma glucosiphilum TaxID=1684307 RepID=A0A316U706_9BASI|nr:hypothetical protein BCV69DRAFT_312251 [Pseudomicrostroma glucosiphilum]PWN20972.1 hypothetical protein BCV69DRAFT_312251 [Pseudomicrostroma glucosiphilum]